MQFNDEYQFFQFIYQVYMPQGHQEHTIYDHFDIAALLNLMGHCKHFRKFIKDQPINKVI